MVFELFTIRDTVYIPPKDFSTSFSEGIMSAIVRKYEGQHQEECGFVVALHDVVGAGEPTLMPGLGGVHVKCTFRLVVFRPEVGEIMHGIVQTSDKQQGLSVSLGDFFPAVNIPVDGLQPGTEFDEQERCFAWLWDGHPLYMDPGEPIRFRVTKFDEKTSDIVGTIRQDGLGLVSWWVPSDDSAPQQ